MAKKFYSTLTDKCYDTEEEFDIAETEFEEAKRAEEEQKKAKEAERKELAEKVDKAFKHYTETKDQYADAVQKAYGEYKVALTEFCNKYGYYHTSINAKTVEDMADSFLKLFFN